MPGACCSQYQKINSFIESKEWDKRTSRVNGKSTFKKHMFIIMIIINDRRGEVKNGLHIASGKLFYIFSLLWCSFCAGWQLKPISLAINLLLKYLIFWCEFFFLANILTSLNHWSTFVIQYFILYSWQWWQRYSHRYLSFSWTKRSIHSHKWSSISIYTRTVGLITERPNLQCYNPKMEWIAIKCIQNGWTAADYVRSLSTIVDHFKYKSSLI